MSELSSSREIPNPIDTLPQDFLGIDPARLAESAAKVRGMAEVAAAREQMNADPGVAHLFGVRAEREEEATQRHINRGACLAQALVNESTLPPTGDADVHRIGFDTPPASGEGYRSAIEELAFLRKRASRGDEGSVTVLEGRINATLQQAGLGDHFETAVANLKGSGMEAPTDPALAKYGAALFALSRAAVHTPRY